MNTRPSALGSFIERLGDVPLMNCCKADTENSDGYCVSVIVAPLIGTQPNGCMTDGGSTLWMTEPTGTAPARVAISSHLLPLRMYSRPSVVLQQGRRSAAVAGWADWKIRLEPVTVPGSARNDLAVTSPPTARVSSTMRWRVTRRV